MRALLILLVLPAMAWGQAPREELIVAYECDVEARVYRATEGDPRAKPAGQCYKAEVCRVFKTTFADNSWTRSAPRCAPPVVRTYADTQKCTLQWVPQPAGQSKKLVCY